MVSAHIDAETMTVEFAVRVPLQRFRDLLCSAVEGGSNYWARFERAERTPELDYVSVYVVEAEASGDARVKMRVDAAVLARGLAKLAVVPTPFPAASTHLANFLSSDDDAETADVVLQMAVFGEVVYG